MRLNRPDYLNQGEMARLFPVLATTSKEGRATSILLSCLSQVDALGVDLMKSVGLKIGKRSRIETYTEIVFSSSSNKGTSDRPDGMIIVSTGTTQKRYLIEAKIGNNTLEFEQIEKYQILCKEHKLDGVITISNQFASKVSHHPLEKIRKGKLKIPVFHWSWMYLLTVVDLLINSQNIEDKSQYFLINELRRFMSHESTGIQGFDRMPSEWTELNKIVQAGGNIPTKSEIATEVVMAWHQETKDLTLILSRLTNTMVNTKLPQKLTNKPDNRLKADLTLLKNENKLVSNIDIPGAAAPIEIIADIKGRTFHVGMTIGAPEDRKSSVARVNWLIRQIKTEDIEDLVLRINWPGSSQATVHDFSTLKDYPEIINDGKEHLQASSFHIYYSHRTGSKFAQQSNFISDLETLVPKFYVQIGQNLSQWQKPSPKISTEDGEIEGVTVNDIASDAEKYDTNEL